MLRTGRDYLDAVRDGRVVYVGGERIADVTSHPGFRGAARTIASIYDLKHDPARREDLVVDDGQGAPYSAYFLPPRTREDLEKRMRCHQHLADATHGLLGRSPDHVASLVTGLAMEAEALDGGAGAAHVQNLRDYYRSARDRDAYIVYAVLPNRASAFEDASQPSGRGLRVVREDDNGLVLHGTKLLATAAAFADDIWIGNLQPLSADREMEAITCVVPVNAPGLQIWSRRSYATCVKHEADGPLAWRFDEGDALLVFDSVKVDWKGVFVHRDPSRSSEIYLRTPAHCMANHQSAVRSRSKLRLLVGWASSIARMNGADEIPAVREVLGRLAAFEATLSGLVDAQVYRCERWPGGGVSPNRRYVYAALNWCQETFPIVIEHLRELAGSSPFKYPASVDVLDSPEAAATFNRFWDVPRSTAAARMQLCKLGWDLFGSEFAGRHQLYERFYAGPPFVVRGHSYREAPWPELASVAARLLDREEPWTDAPLA